MSPEDVKRLTEADIWRRVEDALNALESRNPSEEEIRGVLDNLAADMPGLTFTMERTDRPEDAAFDAFMDAVLAPLNPEDLGEEE